MSWDLDVTCDWSLVSLNIALSHQNACLVCIFDCKLSNNETDYNWYKFKPANDEKYKQKVNSELLNGRLAMIAVGGIATQSIITGHGFPYV